jgi:chromosome segregation ATPase
LLIRRGSLHDGDAVSRAVDEREPQSTNEELETSREELQSLNEELNTVNSQLEEKVDELESTNDDLGNLLSSTEIATIFLDTHLLHSSLHAEVRGMLRLIPADVSAMVTAHHKVEVRERQQTAVATLGRQALAALKWAAP